MQQKILEYQKGPYIEKSNITILKAFKVIFYLFFLIISYACGVYSFTGASISPEVKTISFENFFNNSPLGPSNMSVLFTEKIKDYFERNTSLEIVEENGDLEIEGTIEDFSLSPVAPTAEGGRNAQFFTGLTRLTVRVNASYLNKTDEQFNFENKSFSFYKDFDQNTEDLSSNEQEFVEEIFDQMDHFGGNVLVIKCKNIFFYLYGFTNVSSNLCYLRKHLDIGCKVKTYHLCLFKYSLSENIFGHRTQGYRFSSVSILKKMVEEGKIDKDETTVCYVTGNGLKATESIMSVLTKPQTMQADVAKISAAIG